MNKSCIKDYSVLELPGSLLNCPCHLSPWPPVTMFCLKLCPSTVSWTSLELPTASATHVQACDSFKQWS